MTGVFAAAIAFEARPLLIPHPSKIISAATGGLAGIRISHA